MFKTLAMENKRQTIELSDIFEKNKELFLSSPKLVSTQRKAFRDILSCRTEKLGGHVRECNNCETKEQAYNSCRNRHCPKCQFTKKAKWVDKLASNLPPVKCFHLVFTVPDGLNTLFYLNQRDAYDLLFKAANETIMQTAENIKYLGAKAGGISILHTWGQSLVYHPHIHMIVPAGGLSEDGREWIPAHEKFFLPVKVLSAIFRGILFKHFEKAIQKGEIKLTNDIKDVETLKGIWYKKKWVVYAKKPFAKPDNLINYLGNYTHRVAISNQRILEHTDGKVIFGYKDYKNAGLRKTMSLPEEEFIRRFLQHILPSGFRKIRYFGFMSLRFLKENLDKCVEILNKAVFLPMLEGLNALEVVSFTLNKDMTACKKCKKGRMRAKHKIIASPT